MYVIEEHPKIENHITSTYQIIACNQVPPFGGIQGGKIQGQIH